MPRQFAWLSGWEGPFEGPLTMLWKFSWANYLNSRDVLATLFQRHLSTNDSAVPHRWTLLTCNWMQWKSHDEWAMLFAKHGLNRYTLGWTTKLASDEYFRYCPICSAIGYQSVFAQIDGIARCLVHDTPLLINCERCHAPTPRYAVTADTLKFPGHCLQCHFPFGGRFDAKSWQLGQLLAQKIRKAYLPVAQWLYRLDRISMSNPPRETWFNTGPLNPNEQASRQAIFDMLTNIIPLCINPHFLERPSHSLMKVSGKILPNAEEIGIRERIEQARQAKTSIYKSIRRHLKRHALRCSAKCAHILSHNIEVNRQDGILRLSIHKCPKVQALLLWQLHFENRLDLEPGHERRRPKTINLLTYYKLIWPWRAVADESAWAGYALTSAHAAAEIIDKWWEQACTLIDPDLYGIDRVNAMELFTKFAQALSPLSSPVLPGVSILFEPEIKHHQQQIMFVIGPRNILLADHPCRLCGRLQ
jgi:hypothetical protein